ncbi:mandelate racemase/muconate lactonizing enzyme family protein [Devosia sp. A449]
MIVSKIHGIECSVPPVDIPYGTQRERTYFVLRLETDDGIVGAAITRPNGTPVLDFIKMAAPHYLKSDPALRRATTAKYEKSFRPNAIALQPVISLFDVALWDIAAKQAQLPLYGMLGGHANKVPAMPMIGSHMDSRDIDSLADEAKELMDQGFTRFKLPINGDIETEYTYLERLVPLVKGHMSVDYHWAFGTFNAALKACRSIDDFGLQFIEDPFPAHLVDMTCRLQGKLKTPLAAGEDMTAISEIQRAVTELGLFRLDATRCGGVSGAIRAMSLVEAAGCTALPLTSPELHAQLAGAFSAIEAIEFIHRGNMATPQTILKRPLTYSDGHAVLSDEPGAGWSFDWDRVEACAINKVELLA